MAFFSRIRIMVSSSPHFQYESLLIFHLTEFRGEHCSFGFPFGTFCGWFSLKLSTFQLKLQTPRHNIRVCKVPVNCNSRVICRWCHEMFLCSKTGTFERSNDTRWWFRIRVCASLFLSVFWPSENLLPLLWNHWSLSRISCVELISPIDFLDISFG